RSYASGEPSHPTLSQSLTSFGDSPRQTGSRACGYTSISRLPRAARSDSVIQKRLLTHEIFADTIPFSPRHGYNEFVRCITSLIHRGGPDVFSLSADAENRPSRDRPCRHAGRPRSRTGRVPGETPVAAG